MRSDGTILPPDKLTPSGCLSGGAGNLALAEGGMPQFEAFTEVPEEPLFLSDTDVANNEFQPNGDMPSTTAAEPDTVAATNTLSLLHGAGLLRP
jgi:hypothetical protein